MHHWPETKKLDKMMGNGRTSVLLIRMTWANEAKGEAKKQTANPAPTSPKTCLACPSSSSICKSNQFLDCKLCS